MLTLSIVHQIFLNKDERYKLVKGHLVEVIGVSLPVWSSDTFTTEPVEEIFCKYVLLSNNDPYSINRSEDGYFVTIPLKSNYKLPPYASNEVWRSVSLEAQEAWYDKHQIPPTVKNLLDVQDGGSAYLRFKYHRKMQHKEYAVNVFHYVEIKDIKTLQYSIV